MPVLTSATPARTTIRPRPNPLETPRRLVMDVGMHRGQDTEYYLSRGYRVVAIEAEPGLVSAARQRFAAEIADGRLIIVPCAVAEHDGAAPFWIFPGKDEWNTLDPAHARRNISTGAAHRLGTVHGRNFAGILTEFGVPDYLKIDIEGADLLCVRALAGLSQPPRRLSLELTMLDDEAAFEALARLHGLGYRRFKIVDQALTPFFFRPDGQSFAVGSSGPIGDEAPGAWVSPAMAWRQMQRCRRVERFCNQRHCGRLALVYNGVRRFRAARRNPRAWRATLTTNSWYDLHAARSGSSE